MSASYSSQRGSPRRWELAILNKPVLPKILVFKEGADDVMTGNGLPASFGGDALPIQAWYARDAQLDRRLADNGVPLSGFRGSLVGTLVA